MLKVSILHAKRQECFGSFTTSGLLGKGDSPGVLPQTVRFLRRFGLKTGIDFAHCGLESGTVFEGTQGVYESICRFNSKWIRKKKYVNSK